MYHISVHCVHVLLLLLFCCTVERNNKFWSCKRIATFKMAVTVPSGFVVENTLQTSGLMRKNSWICYKTVLSGTSSDEILIAKLHERYIKAASYLQSCSRHFQRFTSRPVIIYSWFLEDGNRECVPVTLKDTAKQLLANSGSENKHGHIDKQAHIHTALHTTGHISISTPLDLKCSGKKSLKKPFFSSKEITACQLIQQA